MASPPDLSPEQRAAVRLAQDRPDGAIVARAGSGKTFTLREVAASMPDEPATLLAFNRAIAREAAERFPDHVLCTTVHALAYRGTVARDPRLSRKFAAAAQTGADGWAEAVGLSPTDPGRFAHLAAIRAVVRTFCASDDPEPAPCHLPKALVERWRDELGADRAAVRGTWTVRRAARLWRRIADPDDPVPLDHDAYLKLFALGAGRLPGRRLLVDEAQDLAPVMLGLVRAQQTTRLLVGDPAQRIYGWRGAIDAMAASGYPEVRLTRSFRFGPEIAAAARGPLRVLEPGATLVGADAPGEVGDEPLPAGDGRAVLCRSNLGALQAALAYGDRGVHVVGGLAEAIASLEVGFALYERRGASAAARPRARRHARATQGATIRRADAVAGPGPGPSDDLPRPATLAGIDDWEALARAASVEGGGLRTLVHLIERHDQEVPALCRALRRAERHDPAKAQVVVSSVHRAKGREWPVVELWSDLPRVPTEAAELARAADREATTSELNLLYVAATRARRRLAIGRLREDLRELLTRELP